mmetsp:Transcript_16381/g.26276  ORF Transcript_16381/g.26276 Transcript_16381/m.26276 type:complete len:265 (-) Transcript_16381:529-1323(-)
MAHNRTIGSVARVRMVLTTRRMSDRSCQSGCCLHGFWITMQTGTSLTGMGIYLTKDKRHSIPANVVRKTGQHAVFCDFSAATHSSPARLCMVTARQHGKQRRATPCARGPRANVASASYGGMAGVTAWRRMIARRTLAQMPTRNLAQHTPTHCNTLQQINVQHLPRNLHSSSLRLCNFPSLRTRLSFHNPWCCRVPQFARLRMSRPRELMSAGVRAGVVGAVCKRRPCVRARVANYFQSAMRLCSRAYVHRLLLPPLRLLLAVP